MCFRASNVARYHATVNTSRSVKHRIPERGGVLLAAVWLLSFGIYAAGVSWPMRIWDRMVSPHTHLVGTFGVDLAGATRYVMIILVLFGLYGSALWLVLRGGARLTLWQALMGAALLYLVLLPTHPLTSADLFNYISSARVQWVHGANPLTTPPLAFPQDRFYGLLFFWRELPSPYGPLWSLLTLVPHTLGTDGIVPTVLAFKALAVGCMLATGLLVGRAAERLHAGQGAAAALVLTWNPLVVWHVAGNGHNDAVMAVFLALAAYLLARRAPGPAMLAFTASALVKFATVLLVPAALIWWWRRRAAMPWQELAPWALGCVALGVAVYLPYWQGFATFRTALDEGTYFVVSGPAALKGALHRVLLPLDEAELLAAWSGRLTFLCAYVVIARVWLGGGRAGELWSNAVERLLVAGVLVLAAYLLLAATYFAPWYVIWPLTLVAIAPWRVRVLLPILAMTLGAMSILVWATWARARWATDPLGDWYPMHLLAFVSVAGPVALVWLWMARIMPGHAAHHSANVHAPVLEGEIAGTGVEG